MSSIKPPDGKTPGAGSVPAGVDAPGGARRSDPAGAAFNDAVDAVQPKPVAATAAASGASGAAPSDPIAELARAVRSGTIDADQALDRLVERATAGMSKTLSGAQRAELTAVLRAALQNDPALAALRDAIGS